MRRYSLYLLINNIFEKIIGGKMREVHINKIIDTVKELCIEANYYLGEDILYSYFQLLLNDTARHINGEGARLSDVDINGAKGILIEYPNDEMGYATVMWNDGEYVYQLIGYKGDARETIEVARSVKAVKKGE
jgi:hypothetical protein